jgi:hypothetical protein
MLKFSGGFLFPVLAKITIQAHFIELVFLRESRM